MASGADLPPVIRVPVAGFLAWVLPGLGHLFIGERIRGLIYLITIGATFWGGVGIGGVRETVDPRTRTAWFMAQTCTGGHALVGYAWGERVRRDPDAPAWTWGHHRSVETAVVYTGVAGLLNLLAIFDVLVRADAGAVAALATAGTSTRRRGA